MLLKDYIKIAKIGDIINIDGNERIVFYISIKIWPEGNILSCYIEYGYYDDKNGFNSSGILCSSSNDDKNKEIKIIKSNNKNIMKTIKNLFRKEPEKTFIKAGFMNEDENITEKGREALEYILWEANKIQLKELATKVINEEKDGK